MQFTDIPFHKQRLSALRKMVAAGRFPHTVLLTGKDGYGVLYVAMNLASHLLCETEECLRKIQGFNHPDLHFVFPSITSPRAGSETSSSHFTDQWRSFLESGLFGSYDLWMQHLDPGNKQGSIRVKDAEELIQKAYQYPALGKRKVFIVWHAEKMNQATANKLLKLLEEPPENSFFILTTDDPQKIIATIRSRAQDFQIPPIPPGEMKQALLEKGITEQQAEQIIGSAEGDWYKAQKMLESEDPFALHKDYFVRWVRIAYQAKKKPQAINDLIDWAEQLSAESRNFQMDFLRFALEVFRRSYLAHFNPELALFDFEAQQFQMKKFVPFVHSANIELFYHKINEAVYHLVRNANPKLTFLDLSVEMTRLLHKKETGL